MRTISIFNTQHVATLRNRVAKRAQDVAPNDVAPNDVAPNDVAMCCAYRPELGNAGLTMLGYVAMASVPFP